MITDMCSEKYNILNNRIDELKENFSFEQPVEGITKVQSDILRGLRLLCHAEFEDYIENIALDLIEAAETNWDENRIANSNLAGLFISHPQIETKDNYYTKSKQIISDYKKTIESNHGIKEENIKKMFCPLGYQMNDFDAGFIATLSSFGSLRGETAHTSACKAEQSLDQKTELGMIDSILSMLIDFEKTVYSEIS